MSNNYKENQRRELLKLLIENPELAVKSIYDLKKEKEEFFLLAEELLTTKTEWSKDLLGNNTIHLIIPEKRYNEILTQLHGDETT